ncbi:MAG: HRDC domain-containing protein [Alphaproteobacteria bacterium]|nr:HRDC domain-containing protein [Alphaproteobacteria bacterium]
MRPPPPKPYRLILRDDELRDALERLEDPIAVDTEFHSERHYRPRLKLIQLRDRGGEPLIIDPKAVQDLSPVGELLSGRTLIVHALGHDLPLLARHAGLEPGEVIDPQVLAGFCGLGHPRALADLVAGVLGEEMPPGVSLSNWTRRPLSDEQLRYAAADVLWLHDLADRLTERADALGHLEGARATTREHVEEALTPPDTDTWWRHLPGAAVLDGPGRLALRELYVWREREAMERDQPRWQIASDAALLDVARRRPADADELAENRKLSRRLVGEFAPAVLSILRHAEAQPEDAWPPPVAIRGRAAMLNALLNAWAYGVEVERGIAAPLLLPQHLRRDLVLSWLDDRWPQPLAGWRLQAFGEEIAQVIAGEKVLRAPEKPSNTTRM